MAQHFSIKVLSGIYSILQVKDILRLPEIINRTGSGFFSLTRLEGEWTIICEDGRMPDDSLVVVVASSPGWRVFLIDEFLTFDMIGVIYRITEMLKDAGISVMAISAFTTDAFLVREADLQPALRALQAGGFSVPDSAVYPPA